jgi:hypothetical protein
MRAEQWQASFLNPDTRPGLRERIPDG